MTVFGQSSDDLRFPCGLVPNLNSLTIWGRTRIDRIAEVPGGVSRLVSRPRKKRTKIYLPRGLPLSVWLPKSRNGFATGLLPLVPSEDANAGSSRPNRPLRSGLNS